MDKHIKRCVLNSNVSTHKFSTKRGMMKEKKKKKKKKKKEGREEGKKKLYV
jgi:hypothetical protein